MSVNSKVWAITPTIFLLSEIESQINIYLPRVAKTNENKTFDHIFLTVG
jgi:hypothetical protein